MTNGKYIDMTGKVFGCWEILSRAKDFIDGSGCKRVSWNIQCQKCSHKFTAITKYIRLRRQFPKGCHRCKGSVDKRYHPKFKYGVNANGFPDKSVKIYIGEGSDDHGIDLHQRSAPVHEVGKEAPGPEQQGRDQVCD